MNEQLLRLREEMQRESMDIYLITMDDDHQSEYVGQHFKEIAEISGFTGSAGTLVVSAEKAALWTDGRYFVQAETQLENSGVSLMRAGQKDVPTITDYICANIPENGVLGFNGKCVSYTQIKAILAALESKHVRVAYLNDIPDRLWIERPQKICAPCYVLEEKYAGMGASEKLKRVKNVMKDCGAQIHLIPTLDDVAWLLNMRGNDTPCNPVFSAFLMIHNDKVTLYTDEGHLTGNVTAHLLDLGVAIKDEPEIYKDIRLLENEVILVEEEETSYALIQAIPKSVTRINRVLPTTLMKCLKNTTEMQNLKRAHIKDGIAVTKFMHWFKKNIGKIPMSEWSTVEKIEELRKEQEGFVEDSFTTIAAYGKNAAMCHYAPSKEKDTEIHPKGLYLLDSGGQYFEGTTDITRTWACGPCSEEEKRHYTYCVIANLRLADARFLEGVSGLALDYAAREIFWKNGLDFNHGTGHGVGYMLTVHERPVGIRYKIVPERMDSYPLFEGAFLSDEPGVYIEGSHGVRIENLMMCLRDFKNEFGQFMRFEVYTLCPMDTEILLTGIMSDRDIELLNSYHEKVYKNLSPYMSAEERSWLSVVCAPISK